MRLLFYSIIILTVVLAFVLVGQVVYWTSRIFVTKHLAGIIHWVFLGTLVVVIAIASVVGHWYTRHQLEVKHVDIVSAHVPDAFDGFRIAQLSDMHLDWFDSIQGHAFYAQLCQAIQQEQPDIIVFTGDLVTIQSQEADPFRDVLYNLAHIPATRRGEEPFIPVYSILGNHDYADYTRLSAREKVADVQRLCHLQEEAGWQLLRNEGVLLNRQGEVIADTLSSDSASNVANSSTQRIALLGVENIGEPPFSTYGDLKKARQIIAESTEAPYSILLSHNPTHWRSEVLPQTDIDLMLAGHTHAVQLKIGQWSPAQWKYPEWGGLYEASQVRQEDGTPLKSTAATRPQHLYVNTGIGGVGPRVRIGVRPELTILTLKKGNIAAR